MSQVVVDEQEVFQRVVLVGDGGRVRDDRHHDLLDEGVTDRHRARWEGARESVYGQRLTRLIAGIIASDQHELSILRSIVRKSKDGEHGPRRGIWNLKP